MVREVKTNVSFEKKIVYLNNIPWAIFDNPQEYRLDSIFSPFNWPKGDKG